MTVDDGFGVMVGWCATESDLEEAKQQTHDGLIKLMADRRRGGVHWRICQAGTDQAREALAKLFDGADVELADYYRQIAGMMREYGGFMVIALAEGTMA